MRYGSLLLTALGVLVCTLYGTKAFAGDWPACLPLHTVTSHSASMESPVFTDTSTNLVSQNRYGHFVTRAKAILRQDDRGYTKLEVYYPRSRRQTGLPVKLYGAEVVINRKQALFIDLTGGCTAPGPSIYPGERIHFATEDLDTVLQRECEQGCETRLRIWAIL